MKLILDERVKHRLTGLVVIVSIAVIFLPAMLKKSTHHFTDHVSIPLKLPHKPALPSVAVSNPTTLFKSAKVAHVKLPIVPKVTHATEFAKAVPLAPPRRESQVVVANNEPAPNRVERIKKEEASVPPVLKQKTSKKTSPLVKAKVTASVAHRPYYAVRLASFTQKNNAELLVARLQKQGYKVSYSKFTNKQGAFYQVLVGQLDAKEQAQHLQKKLATQTQMRGLVVKNNIG